MQSKPLAQLSLVIRTEATTAIVSPSQPASRPDRLTTIFMSGFLVTVALIVPFPVAVKGNAHVRSGVVTVPSAVCLRHQQPAAEGCGRCAGPRGPYGPAPKDL